jgi:hypothetical protein
MLSCSVEKTAALKGAFKYKEDCPKATGRITNPRKLIRRIKRMWSILNNKFNLILLD